MKFLGVGLSRTGTTSLHVAFLRLGLRSLHADRERLNHVMDGSDPSPAFRVYDDFDAVTDLPAACFYRELLSAYPAAKAILTVRDVDSWWASIRHHFNERNPVTPSDMAQPSADTAWRAAMRNFTYGSVVAHEYLYKKRYLEHNARVRAEIPADRLLIMNITKGDGWEKLCPFVGRPIPAKPFPHKNKA